MQELQKGSNEGCFSLARLAVPGQCQNTRRPQERETSSSFLRGARTQRDVGLAYIVDTAPMRARLHLAAKRALEDLELSRRRGQVATQHTRS